MITATPPANLAIRSCSFSPSYSESVSAACLRNCSTRFCTAAVVLGSVLATIVVFSFTIVILLAVPNISIDTVSRVNPTSSEITLPPVRIAIS